MAGWRGRQFKNRGPPGPDHLLQFCSVQPAAEVEDLSYVSAMWIWSWFRVSDVSLFTLYPFKVHVVVVLRDGQDLEVGLRRKFCNVIPGVCNAL